VEDGEYKLNIDPPRLRPVKDYLLMQGRFRHLPKEVLEEIQTRVDKEYANLKSRVK